MRFEQLIKHTLQLEGGYVNDPDDLGGETKYGITKRRYPDVDIAALSVEDATALYRRDFWDELNMDALPARIRYLIFDGCVNQGPAWTIRMLQRLAGVAQDGVIGPVTAEAAKQVTPEQVAKTRRYRYQRIARYRNNRKFLSGWLRRLDSAIEFQGRYTASVEANQPASTCPECGSKF